MAARMRVADYITAKLYDAGGESVFLVTGGMIMHLTDALLRHGRQRYVCCHHEQAATMAAEAYGRLTGRLGVAYVTAGPGALNTLTGVVGAYVDSSPCVIVAGQSKVSQATVRGPRQFSLQGFNTLPLFQQVTKYAVMLQDISRVRYEVEKCIHIAKRPRVGPVWLECPIDIQGATFCPEDFPGYIPEPVAPGGTPNLDAQVQQVVEAIRTSRRPCILAGAGVRLAGAVDTLHRFVDATGIPVLTSRLGMDLMGHDHPLFAGRPGTYGERAANFAVQNADLLLTIGCRMGIGLVGYDFQDFARHAKKIMVDIDEQELAKPSVVPDIAVRADARDFLEKCLSVLGGCRPANPRWVEQTQHWRQAYPVDLPEYCDETEGVNSYHFMRLFSDALPPDAVVVVDTGSCFHVHAQAFNVKFGQRHIITGGLSTMGYMPGVVGVAAAVPDKNAYCITGDGSLQMNLQELQTIVQNRMRAKLVVLNNNGYLLIRLTQQNFQEGRFIGVDKATGLSCPDLEKIAFAYGIHFLRIVALSELESKLGEFLRYPAAAICEVMTPSSQRLIPRVASRKLEDGRMVSMPYDDMFPFLPRDEYQRNCVRDTLG